MGKTRSKWGVRDQIKQELYDTITIGAAENPQGVTRSFYSDVQGKAKYLSNMRLNNTLEGQVSFLLKGIGIESYNQVPGNQLALGLIMEHSFIKLRIGEKDYWQGPMRFICGKIYKETGVVASDFTQFGTPKMQGLVYRGAGETQEIAPVQTFAAEWFIEGMTVAEQGQATPVAASKLNFIFKMIGLLRRPVQ